MKRIIVLAALCLMLAAAMSPVRLNAEESGNTSNKLAVVWSSADPDVANRVAFMYTHNAKKAGWFDEVRLVVWGPSQHLLVQDKGLQAKLKTMQEDGVVVEACIACAMSYGIVEDLKALGIDVRGMGEPLSDYLKSGWKVITF